MTANIRHCPVCGGRLTEARLESVVIDHCRRGCGNFFDKGEAEAVISPILSPAVWDTAGFVRSKPQAIAKARPRRNPWSALF